MLSTDPAHYQQAVYEGGMMRVHMGLYVRCNMRMQKILQSAKFSNMSVSTISAQDTAGEHMLFAWW